jgi:hypothetical protein
MSVPGRPFQKGQSGNPTGRPKRDREIEELARQHTPAAIEALLRALNDKDRVPAAALLLAYGFGKPRQLAEASITADVTHQATYVDRPPQETREEWLARRRGELNDKALRIAPPAGSH